MGHAGRCLRVLGNWRCRDRDDGVGRHDRTSDCDDGERDHNPRDDSYDGRRGSNHLPA
jgi:hypothetical protein